MGGLGAGAIGQPVIIGFIVAGSLIGPGGLGIIEELVQVETLAQFGAIFLLFALGVEFSMEKLLPVRFVALAGGAGITGILGSGPARLITPDPCRGHAFVSLRAQPTSDREPEGSTGAAAFIGTT